LYKILGSLLISCSFTFASLVGSNYNQRDLLVLKELDIDTAYITDYKLQKTYSRFLTKSQSKYVEKLNDASLFVPKIKAILREEGMPSSFLYLAMAESYLNLSARSAVSAAGVWQFMPRTGRSFGLQNDLYVDERLDLVKSTYAASKYLKRLHGMFGKWYLAAMAYNCGEGRVIEAITRATIDMYVEDNGKNHNRKQIRKFRKTIKDYQKKRVRFSALYKVYKEVIKWDYKPDVNELLKVQKGLRRQYLPKESREYIRKIISLGFMNNREFITSADNSHLLNIGSTGSIATIYVKGGMHLKNVAQVVGIDYKELTNLNRHIKRYIVPPEADTYPIYIPYSRLTRFNANKGSLKKASYAMHIVKKGDSLGVIGRKYKVSYKLIKKYNKLKSNFLSINQRLIIPVSLEDLPPKPAFYLVKRGDTLDSISKKYKVNLKQLMKDNNKKTSLIRIGDKIVINY